MILEIVIYQDFLDRVFLYLFFNNYDNIFLGDDNMKWTKLIDILKNRSINIPIYLLKNYKKFNIGMDEFIFLMYLYNLGDKFLFDPNRFAEELNYTIKDVLSYVDVLTDKGLIRVDVLKNNKDVREEVVILEGFYNKLSLIAMEDINNNEEEVVNSSVFDVLESEFGRSLTPMEYEISKAWLNDGISEELIIEAIKEAVFNHVINLKYIDKILYEWKKNNIKTVKDVENNRKKRSSKKEEKTNIDLDMVDWNWFDDEE